MSRVLMPLPQHDFDPTESAVPWYVLTEAGHEVVFATPNGQPAYADEVVLRGPLGALSGSMKTSADAAAAHRQMIDSNEYLSPGRWDAMPDADALFLVGGHAPKMKQYLDSELVRAAVLTMWPEKPVAAICHGVLVLARTIDPDTGRSVLNGRRSTCLPSYMEQLAWRSTSWKLGSYYKTYPKDVEDEVRDALGARGQFERGPTHLFAKGTEHDDQAAFVVEDGNYVSGRWPGDAWLIARKLVERLT